MGVDGSAIQGAWHSTVMTDRRAIRETLPLVLSCAHAVSVAAVHTVSEEQI